MNRLLLFLVTLLLSGLPVAAATGLSSLIFTNLNTKSFSVTLSGQPTNMVRVNLNPTQFDTNATTITLTNITGIPGGGSPANTNQLYDGTQFLNIAVGSNNVLHLIDGVLTTNLHSALTLSADGAFLMPYSGSVNLLSTGTNDINVYQLGFIRLVGPTTNAADSIVSLAAGNGQGQLVILENSATNSSFTMINGSTNWDGSGSLILPNGNWTPSVKGERILLHNDGDTWSEVVRFGGNTNTSSFVFNTTTNYFLAAGTNVVIEVTTLGTNVTFTVNNSATPATNIAINATDTYLPARLNSTTFTNSGLYTVLATNIGLDGQFFFGPTNVFRRVGSDINVTNGATSPLFTVVNGSGNSMSVGLSGSSGAIRTSGDSLKVFQGASGTTLFDNTSGTGTPLVSIGAGIINLQRQSIGSVVPIQTYGVLVQNQTAATSGVQQNSPAITWTSQGYGTNSATSQAVVFGGYVLPTPGADTPTGLLKFSCIISNGASVEVFGIDSQGPVVLAKGITKSQKTAILNPSNGMIVYQTDNTPGLRAYVNGAWVIISTAADP